MPLAALADTGLPPPAVHQTTQNSFPSSQALQRQGYDPSRGVLRVQDTNQGRPTVTSSGGTVTGTQNKSVTVTGKYGEKATISTATTQKVGGATLSKLVGTAYVGSVIANAANASDRLFNDIKNGNYSDIPSSAAAVGAAALDGILGGAGSAAASAYDRATNSNTFGTNPSQQAPNNSVNTAKLAEIAKDATKKQADAEKAGDFGGAAANAAVKKAAEAASAPAAQKQKFEQDKKDAEKTGKKLRLVRIQETGVEEPPNGRKIVHEKITWKSYTSEHVTHGRADFGSYRVNGSTFSLKLAEDLIINYDVQYPKSENFPYGSSIFISMYPANNAPSEATASNISPEDVVLSGSEVEAILKRMLESQQTNHEQLMKQLSKIGDAVQKSTTSQEWAPKTATTEPYTPAGSDTPQQTQFSIDKNGNITATTIPRPDLKPNSSQAPMRTEVIKNPNAQSQQNGQQQQGEQGQNQQGQQQNQQGQQQNQQGQNTNQTGQQQNQTGQQTGQTGQTTATTGQNAQQQNQQQQNFCQQNPRAAACADLGEADYEDLQIPEQVIDFNLNPADAFQSNGTCPASKTFDLGMLGSFEVTYEHVCYVASLIRPILILITMMGCFSFAYAAVREI